MATEELSLRGIPFDYIDLDEIKKTAAEVTGRKVTTVPQIYLEGRYIGGYEDLMSFLTDEAYTNLGRVKNVAPAKHLIRSVDCSSPTAIYSLKP